MLLHNSIEYGSEFIGGRGLAFKTLTRRRAEGSADMSWRDDMCDGIGIFFDTILPIHMVWYVSMVW